jgi:flavin reductase (DIM6/NTAB) family NADH-FMN oxidoreductase RutF
MPGEPTPLGPFPEGADPDSYDRLRRKILWSMPSGLYVLGSRASGRRNLMTLNWACQVATAPKLVAVSVEESAVTRALVREGRVFALSILRREDRSVVRRFVKPLTDDQGPDHLGGFAVRSYTTGAPVLDTAAAWLDCELRHELDFASHTLFVGEVVDCGALADAGAVEAGALTDAGAVEILRMEDTKMHYGG